MAKTKAKVKVPKASDKIAVPYGPPPRMTKEDELTMVADLMDRPKQELVLALTKIFSGLSRALPNLESLVTTPGMKEKMERGFDKGDIDEATLKLISESLVYLLKVTDTLLKVGNDLFDEESHHKGCDSCPSRDACSDDCGMGDDEFEVKVKSPKKDLGYIR
jgi:hypothetical protein